MKIEEEHEILAADINYKVTCWSHSTIYMRPEGICDPRHRKPAYSLAIYCSNRRNLAKNDKKDAGLESPSGHGALQ